MSPREIENNSSCIILGGNKVYYGNVKAYSLEAEFLTSRFSLFCLPRGSIYLKRNF